VHFNHRPYRRQYSNGVLAGIRETAAMAEICAPGDCSISGFALNLRMLMLLGI
jgi:hypothetical protein